MKDCCVKLVPQSDSSHETFAVPVAGWQARLTAGLNQSVQASDETPGHMEEQILQQTRGLERKLLEEAAQKKTDQTPPVCPVCGHKLSRRTWRIWKTIVSRWTTQPHGVRVNRGAAAPSNQPGGNTNAASNGQDSSGVWSVMKD